MLEALGLSNNKVLILTANTDHTIVKSASNIPGVHVLEGNKPNTYQMLHADTIIIQKSALEVLENSIIPNTEEVQA